MKLNTKIYSLLLVGNGVLASRKNKQNIERTSERTERRYAQLIEMMKNYNELFDERTYWTYGCNCLILGDRPMSDPGYGRPVDDLDAECKAYKDCLKCARRAHGDTCIGEFVQYKFNIKRGQVQCRSDADSCERSLCECDKKFAENHVAVAAVYNKDYHSFFSEVGWQPEAQCRRAVNNYNDPQCCGGSEQPFVLYNANRKTCCPDGTVKPNGTC